MHKPANPIPNMPVCLYTACLLPLQLMCDVCHAMHISDCQHTPPQKLRCNRVMPAGYTGCQPRPEQMKGTPDHTQGTIRACDPEGEKTHCRLIPSYAGLANATNVMQQQSSRGVPKLDLGTVTALRGHAGKDPCLLAGQCSSRAAYGIQSSSARPQTSPVRIQSGLMGAATSPMASGSSPMGNACTPAHSRSEGEAAPAPAYTARPATSYESCYGQGGFQPMSVRAVHRPCTTGHYHASGANTWRGPYGYPLALGTSR